MFLYRGFTVKNLNEITKKGFAIANPRTGNGESNWPGGLSLSRTDAFTLAEDIAKNNKQIPVCGRIEINEENLEYIYLVGIKRITNPEEGMSAGSIDSWRCLTSNDLNKAWEFTIRPDDLRPDILSNQLKASVSTKKGIYVPINEIKVAKEGNIFSDWIKRS